MINKSKNFSSGEIELIRYIRKRFPRKRKEIIKGIGDDAMLFRNGFVVSTDSFFEAVHFDLKYFSFSALGYHCLAAGLSDLAAMGALPICALVSLNLTKKIKKSDIEQLYGGFAKLANQHRVDIAGGDIVASPCFGMSITVIGRVRKALMRSGASPGQALFVTNFLGLAEVGRAVLQHDLPQREYPEAVQKHLFPEPRIREAQAIQRYARSCIDTSDGLSTDAFHLAEESRAKIVIEAEHIPIHSEVGEYCSIRKVDPLDFILSAGEDFELLFTAYRLPKIPGVKIFRIGTVMKGRGIFVAHRGKTSPIKPSGYEHIV